MSDKEKKKSGCGGWLWLIIIFGFIGFLNDDGENNNSQNNSVEYTSETNEEQNENENEVVQEETITDSILQYIDSTTAKNLESIYLEKIGFENLRFEEKLGETSNYQIVANGYYTVATVMDDYVRIFIPDTDYVFYEDGNVLMTYKELEDSRISDGDMVYYYSIAQIIVEQNLKIPDSAKFPTSKNISYQKKDNLIAIKGYVDAKNSLGLNVRSDFVVQFTVTDLKNLQYELNYIELNGEKSGTFIEY